MPETFIGLAAVFAIQFAVVVRVLLRPHRDPSSRIAWTVVVLAVPGIGIVAYLLLGETSIGRKRIARMRRVLEGMPPFADAVRGHPQLLAPAVAKNHRHLFAVGESLSSLAAVGGNAGRLLADSNATIDAMVADIDAAKSHVHVLFYIWLTDNNGRKIVDALKRASGRGVVCRAMADGLGSRSMIRSVHWQAMREAGVNVGIALRLNNPLLRALTGRIDLRNHRKIVVVDGGITYCGSQNCADPEFRVKPDYAPWVDIMVRFEGPVARQNQHLFASDWMTYTDEDIRELLSAPLSAASTGGFPAQVIATGPTVRYSAMPEVFETLMHSARRELIITTPYYVPTESLQDALCAAAYRGVVTTLIVPERNDSRIVAAASRSYYAELLAAGVRVHEYADGLLHAKTLTVDGEVTLIGSANLDRRSFELNYENNILFVDGALTEAIRERQAQYLAQSARVKAVDVAVWPLPRRLLNNVMAMLGPVL